MNCSDGSNRATACTFEANDPEGREKINLAVHGLDKIAGTFQENFTNVKKEIFDIRRELDIAGREFSLLKSQICTYLNLIRPSPPSASVIDNYSLSMNHSATSCNFQQQRCDEGELLNWDLLTQINKKVHRLGNITSESFDSLFEALRVVKEDGKRHNLALNELRKVVEKNTDALRHLGVVDAISTHGNSAPVISKSNTSCSVF